MIENVKPTPRVVAIVPIRHHSERVPGKNHRPFCGVPLFRWVLEMLLSCHTLEQVVVDTDSNIIKEQCSEHYPSVLVIDRPASLRGGFVPMNEILLHDVDRLQGDVFLQTHSTNPLLRAETVTEACEVFLESTPKHDSLFSVTRRQVRLWNSDHQPINHDPRVLLRTQDLPPVYEENSCLYLFTRESIECARNRIGHQPLLFEMDGLEAWDIDCEVDFEIGQRIFEVVRLGRRSE